MMRLAVALAVMIWAGAAAADLYRWVDPESGSVKFSSYPPPWYGDKAKQRRAPRVVLIPAGRDATAKPDARDVSLQDAAIRAEERKALEKAAKEGAK